MIRNTALAVAATSALFLGGAAQASTVDLGFIVDRSGSVGNTNFDNTLLALKSSLLSIDTTTDVKYSISIVTFSGTNAANGVTSVVANNVLLDSDTAKSNLAGLIDDHIAAINIGGGDLTNYERAFEEMANLETSGDVSILNFATDGDPTQGDETIASLADEILALQNAGWDAMNVEAIGSGVSGSSLLQGLGFDTQINVSFDPNTDPLSAFLVGGSLQNGNCAGINSSAGIVNPISDCFVVDTTFADLPSVYQTKISATVDLTGGQINPIPLPAGLPLLAVGIGMLGFSARRRRKAL